MSPRSHSRNGGALPPDPGLVSGRGALAEEIALTGDNRAMIITGTGDVFMYQIDGPSIGAIAKFAHWDIRIASERATDGDLPHPTFEITAGDGLQVIWEAVELERFFLNAKALELARTKRRRHNRLGWAVQWGTVRMLGTLLEVPQVVVENAAEQLGVDDPSCVKAYAERVQTRYEHAWEIRELLGFRDFTDETEAEVTAFVASRAAMTRDSRQELFDRAVLWLIENRALLPGLSTLSRLVTEVRGARLEALNEKIVAAAPVHMRRELIGTLAVPDGKRISTLQWMRTPVVKTSAQVTADADPAGRRRTR
jgi:hypothetical protein